MLQPCDGGGVGGCGAGWAAGDDHLLPPGGQPHPDGGGQGAGPALHIFSLPRHSPGIVTLYTVFTIVLTVQNTA